MVDNPNRVLLIAVAIVAVSYIGVALPYPILAPLFLSNGSASLLDGAFGLSPEMALGLVLAVYPVGMFIGNQILGSASDKYGRRLPLLISLVGGSLGYLFSALALTQEHYPLLLASRLITGVFEGNVPIARAIAADLSPRIPKSTSFGYTAGAVYAGYLIGPVLGGMLAAFGYAAPFFVACGITLCMAVTVAVWLPETATLRQRHEPVRKSLNPWGLLKTPLYAHLFATNLLLGLGISAYYQFYPIFLVERWRFVSLDIAYITVLITVALMISSLLLVRWSARRFSIASNIMVAGLCLPVLLIVMLIPESRGYVWLTFPLVGFAIPMASTHLSVYTSDKVSGAAQGRLMGLLGSGGALGTCGVILIGAVMTRTSAMLPIIFGALLSFSAILYFAMIHRRLSARGGRPWPKAAVLEKEYEGE